MPSERAHFDGPRFTQRQLPRDFHNRLALNLASGNDYRERFINLDLYSTKADVRHDLEKFPYPFPSNLFDFILADQIFEHLPDRLDGNDAVLRVLRELHRILKPGGLLYIGTPYPGRAAWKNLTHRRLFYPETLQTLDPSSKYWDESIARQAGITFHVPHVRVLRRCKIFFFDSVYHPAKYLRKPWNIGRKYSIEWWLQK